MSRFQGISKFPLLSIYYLLHYFPWVAVESCRAEHHNIVWHRNGIIAHFSTSDVFPLVWSKLWNNQKSFTFSSFFLLCLINLNVIILPLDVFFLQNHWRMSREIYSDLPRETVEFFLWKKRNQRPAIKNNLILRALISRVLNQFPSNPASVISSTYCL